MDKPNEYSSPPCFMHELMPELRVPDASQWRDVKRFRKAERERLIELRMGQTPQQRAAGSLRIASRLTAIIGDASGQSIGVYWPFRGEPDLRDWMSDMVQSGASVALPVVTERNQPLEYRSWTPGCRLERGLWNIMVPANERVPSPSIIIAPLVGYDTGRYRLGYGGGYFDRTLASLQTKPRIIGVGFAFSRIGTIYPQPHDIAMDLIVTDE
jgi:5-formyltetrahydrofolate cyclo-ligase